MAEHDNHQPEPMSDQRRAFLEYKRRVAEHGKPFFPNGTYHDVIAATGIMVLLIVLSTMWFSMANCDSWWNPTCDRVATPAEQEQYTPKEPGAVFRTKGGELDESVDKPLLGLLYEEKADPSTTSYHPRPEWYFYFLFYLLIIFANPQLVVLGTIIVPTLWLMMLIAWPFVDRKKERRPSRRPVAMAAMVLTAITLLSFTYLGSQSGKETGGPEGLSEGQLAMPGYAVLFEEGIYETCGSCHQLGGVGNGGPGPNLDAVGTRYDSVDDIIEVLAKGLGGGAMPVKGGSSMTDEQAAQVAAFLKTLGAPGEAESLGSVGQTDWDRVTGGKTAGSGEDATDADDRGDAGDPATVGGQTEGGVDDEGASSDDGLAKDDDGSPE
ncbi:MAG: Cytochrome b subunit of the bc complex-like protein [Thermoleophilia bacterium]|nr:Cytochrome b subunit of the bc complex-like protein [Thermoleophilia bacterium]